MSSREIAKLTGKQHKNVLADIRAMLRELQLQPADFSARYRDEKGEFRVAFNLPKRETLILVSGYNIKMRAAIIDRWQELEKQAAKPAVQLPDFTNPAIAARAWADEVEQKLLLENKVQELQPKARVFDLIASSEGLYLPTVARKHLGLSRPAFGQLLVQDRWAYKVGGSWVGYRERESSGQVVNRVTQFIDKWGVQRAGTQLLFTTAGMEALAAGHLQGRAS